MISGRLARARATATRCCWPPESSLGRCLRRSLRPTVVTTWSSQSLSGARPARSMGRVMFSMAVRVGMRLKAWKMKPTRSRRRSVSSRSDSVVRSSSPIQTFPLLRPSRPAMQCIRVDLPEPDGPMMAVNWPCMKSTSTDLRAMTSVSPWPYTLVAPRAEAAAVIVVGWSSVSVMSVFLLRGRASRR